MQSVPAPPLIGAHARQRRRIGGRLLATAALSAAALAASLPLVHGGSSSGPAAPGLALVGGMPLQQARCEQWLAAGQAERDRALSALHGVVGGPTPFGPATALTHDEAERLFDRRCASPVAQHFLLYELYTRAAGFRSLAVH
jgi:hypothetical protein